MQKNIKKIFSVLEIISFELVALRTHFYKERIILIRSQYINKQSHDFRYYSKRMFQTEVLSE